jgi:hypothetical protein
MSERSPLLRGAGWIAIGPLAAACPQTGSRFADFDAADEHGSGTLRLAEVNAYR